MPLPVLASVGQIAVNAAPMTTVNLVTAAWGPYDFSASGGGFSDLFRGPDVAGSNLRIPGAVDFPQRRFPTTSTRQFPLFVAGDCDHTGATFADPVEGIESNINHLRAHVFDPPSVADRPDGTRELTMTMPSGATRAAVAHFKPFAVSSAAPSGWLLLCEVELVAGTFV